MVVGIVRTIVYIGPRTKAYFVIVKLGRGRRENWLRKRRNSQKQVNWENVAKEKATTEKKKL